MQKERAEIPAHIEPGACDYSNCRARTTWALDLKFFRAPLPTAYSVQGNCGGGQSHWHIWVQTDTAARAQKGNKSCRARARAAAAARDSQFKLGSAAWPRWGCQWHLGRWTVADPTVPGHFLHLFATLARPGVRHALAAACSLRQVTYYTAIT